ncbi:hypothetical protein J1605_010688 [Eschrichtius robustus]|uniref:Microtubule-associated protein 1B/S N-terminal domain-containing protein n=1 Tax=Eschrichtius robustus TaxID=9764 RepID=A0AB34GTG7_ESCRO|nr:hypothetical protein J1605_010688 [Eschrichtius robustus]
MFPPAWASGLLCALALGERRGGASGQGLEDLWVKTGQRRELAEERAGLAGRGLCFSRPSYCFFIKRLPAWAETIAGVALAAEMLQPPKATVFWGRRVRLMITDAARHKLLVLTGQCFENTGELILQSGSFSFQNFIEIFTDQEVDMEQQNLYGWLQITQFYRHTVQRSC